jgi:hypothetical protein
MIIIVIILMTIIIISNVINFHSYTIITVFTIKFSTKVWAGVVAVGGPTDSTVLTSSFKTGGILLAEIMIAYLL